MSGAVSAGAFLAALNVYFVGVVAPAMVGDFGSLGLYSWVFSIHMLAAVAATPIFGRLSDQVGWRPLFVVAGLAFTIGSLLTGVAGSPGVLLAGRVIQGIASGGLLALFYVALRHSYLSAELPRVQWYLDAMYAAAAFVGPTVAGLLLLGPGWRWGFLASAPLGLALLLLLRRVPASRGAERRAALQVDYPGAIVFVGLAGSVLFALSRLGDGADWRAPSVLGSLALGLLLGLVFIEIEVRAARPLVPLSLFRFRSFVAANVNSLCTGAASSVNMAIVPLFLTHVVEVAPVATGATLLGFELGWMSSTYAFGRLVGRLGYRAVTLLATILLMMSLGLLAQLTPRHTMLEIAAVVVLTGLASGIGLPAIVSAVQHDVPSHDAGVAASAVSFFRLAGAAVGLGVAGIVLASHLSASLRALANRYLPLSTLGPGEEIQLLRNPLVQAQLPAGALGQIREELAAALAAAEMALLAILLLGLVAALFVPNAHPRPPRSDEWAVGSGQ